MEPSPLTQKVIPSRLFLRPGEYQYIPKDLTNDKIIGLITPNVCECVCGFLSSDQGFGFFHFSSGCVPNDLAEKLKKDFQNATSVRITLIGGNLIPGFSPWKEKNRELTYNDKEKNIKVCGDEAKEQYRQWGRSSFGTHSYKDYKDLTKVLAECSKKVFEEKNLVNFDYSLLNKRLAEKSYQAVDQHDLFSFKICGFKDFVGFQNLAKVINILTDNPELFTGDNIKHYNNPWGNDVTADFNGDFNSVRNGSFLGVEGEFDIEKSIENHPTQKIAQTNEYIENKSIKNKVAIGFQSID